jgi:REP element-mobilizing transposase RayT
MSRKYKFRDQEAVHHVTFTVIYWLDVFTRDEYRHIFLESIKYCQKNKGLEVYAYCIMTNHVHMIIGRHGKTPLSGIVRDIKKFTATRIIQAMMNNEQESRRKLFHWLFDRAGAYNSNNEHYQFWQQHNHPIELNTEEKLEQRLNYIHENPVKAGIVSYPEHYVYSSARNYAGVGETMLDVILI